jgi:hypothetical protein
MVLPPAYPAPYPSFSAAIANSQHMVIMSFPATMSSHHDRALQREIGSLFFGELCHNHFDITGWRAGIEANDGRVCTERTVWLDILQRSSLSGKQQEEERRDGQALGSNEAATE